MPKAAARAASDNVLRCWPSHDPRTLEKAILGVARTGSVCSWPRVLFWHCKGRGGPAQARRGGDSLALSTSPMWLPRWTLVRQARTDHSRTCHRSIRQSRDTRVVPGSRLAALKTQRGSFINAALGAPHQPRPARASSASLPAAEKYGTVTRLPPLWHWKRLWPVPHTLGPRRVGPLLLYGRSASVASQPLDFGLQTLVTLTFFFFPWPACFLLLTWYPLFVPTAAQLVCSAQMCHGGAEKGRPPRRNAGVVLAEPANPARQPPSRLAVARSVVAKRCRATGLHRGDQRPIVGTVKRDAVRANICKVR
jgi:hypothetical protein